MSDTEITLGTYCGITFAGIKAASLFSIKRECAKCIGKYIRHFKKRGFNFYILKAESKRLLLYVYNAEQMQRILFDEQNRQFLRKRGYEYETVEQALSILKANMASGEFPHEIGIFLGYPIEDVKGFIAHPNADVQLVGYWKVYEGAERKKRIFDRYEKCTKNIVGKLYSGIPLEQIFNGGSAAAAT